jgi:hypothetical protein
MPELRFIERRDKVQVIGRLGPFERGSDLFWRELVSQMWIAEWRNAGRRAGSLSWQTIYVLDGNRRETNGADI